MNNNIYSENGFTLIEILLAVTILTAVMVSLVGAINNVMSVMAREEIQSALRQDGHLALERIVNDLRKAREIKLLREDKISFKGYDQDGSLQWMCYKLYNSEGVPALGLVRGITMPVINNVSSIRFIDVYGDQSIIKIILKIEGAGGCEEVFVDYVRGEF